MLQGRAGTFWELSHSTLRMVKTTMEPTMVTMDKAMVANLFRLLRLVPNVRETTPM